MSIEITVTRLVAVVVTDPPQITVSPSVAQTVVVDIGGTGPQGLPGPQGPQGLPGISGALIESARQSSGAISDLRVVRDVGDGVHIAVATPTNARAILGLSRNSASGANQTVNVIEFGEITDPSWTWTQGPVFLDAVGQLTQTPTLTDALVQIAEALSPTKLLVNIRAPIGRG